MAKQQQGKRILKRREFLATVSAGAMGIAAIGSAAVLDGCTDLGPAATGQLILNSFFALITGAASNSGGTSSSVHGTAPSGGDAAMPVIGTCSALAGVNDGPRTIHFSVTTQGTQDLFISGQGLADFYHISNNGVEGTTSGSTTQAVTLNVANNPPSNTFIVNVVGENASGTSVPAQVQVNLNNMTCSWLNAD